jgi:hypothetical protein
MLRKYCRRCWQPDVAALTHGPDCPILNQALAGTPPKQWDSADGCSARRSNGFCTVLR